MSASAVVLTGFIAWTLALMLLMVVLRVQLVVSRKVGCSSWRY